jgi:SAM-dependent methyltransferase
VIDLPVSTDIITSAERRPWNADWSLYDRIMAAGPAGKRVLIPGCGFGDDAIRLAMLGAEVSTFDLSPESVEIARERARRAGQTDIDFRVMPAESMADYPADHFDLVVFVDILHHVDIAATMAEVVRVMQPGGVLLAIEPDYGGMVEHPPELATRELWMAGLARAGADPLVGRKLPGLLASHGFDVQVELMNELTPPAAQRFDLLRGLPLKRKERRQAKAIERSAKRLSEPWQQVVHLPFMLVTARLPEAVNEHKRWWLSALKGRSS